MALETPSYYRYYAQTYRLDATPDGGVKGTILDLRTGLFEENNEHIREVLFARDSFDIGKLTEEKFVQETEAARLAYLRGDGPIFALYDTIKGIDAVADKEKRSRTTQETALVFALYKRTFKLWEEEAARRAAGEPPSFQVTTRWQQADPER